MTFKEFIKKYNRKFVEAGGSANALNQCVDLVNQYIVDVLGLSKILWTDANNLHNKAGSKYTWIPNTRFNKPKNGDIIIWGLGKWGHTGIFAEGNRSVFKSFDQNYPVGSPAHIQEHNYNNVLGWLRPKGLTMSQYTDLKKQIEKSNKRIEEVLKYAKDLRKDTSNIIHVRINKEIVGMIAGNSTRIIELQKKIAKLEKTKGHTADESQAITFIGKKWNEFKNWLK